ncbi:hypothetical protein T484DRAFT_2301696 [Baffinella frigidus]|nr:hypothetical protein T484DRAFT_2301696 [Cryptophyta sp. CCMP2293]
MPGEGEKTALERDAPVVVAGAGLVGCMSAILLGRRGYDIKVYEGRESWTEDVNASKGLMGQLSNAKKRSINLALSHRGLSALIKVGLADEVLENSVAMHGRMIHPPGETDHAKTDFQPYDHKAGNHIYSISREELNQALLDEIATMDNVSVEYDRKFESMDQDKMTCTLASGKGVRHTVPAKFCLGADGAFSKVRDWGFVLRVEFSCSRNRPQLHRLHQTCIRPDVHRGQRRHEHRDGLGLEVARRHRV